jgi:hypothetical protein
MKRIAKWTVAVLLLAAIWFAVPFAGKKYVNKKYGPEIRVGSLSIVSLDCVRVNNVLVNKPNVTGTIDSAVVCVRAKTVNANGGKLEVVLGKSSGKDVSQSHGMEIHATNLNLHIIKGNIEANIFGATVHPSVICAKELYAIHPKAIAVIWEPCIRRDLSNVSAVKGKISPFEFKGHEIEDIWFDGLSNASRTGFNVISIKYEDSILHHVSANIKDGKATVSVGSAEVFHKKLFTGPLTIKDVVITGIDRENPLASKVSVKINNTTDILVDVEKKRISGKNTCKDWLDIVPQELKEGPISEMRVKGNFGFDIQFAPVSLKISNSCAIDGPPPSFITKLNKPFTYTVYHPDGKPFDRKAGPGTEDWIPLDFVDNMSTALTITEDPGFWKHRGIIPQALENSLKVDLRLGRFFRGGSTITMQLAKNLWLNRSRTLGRKIQEGILTVALESCLTKEKILELYLNVIEFGPDTYGIGPGSMRFLKKFPGEMSLSESLYMASRLPSPNHARSYEQTKGFIKKLIDIGVATGKITEEDLYSEWQAEQVTQEEDEEPE